MLLVSFGQHSGGRSGDSKEIGILGHEIDILGKEIEVWGQEIGALGQEMGILEQGRRTGGCWAGRSWSTNLSHLWGLFCSSLKVPLGRIRFLPTRWVSN